MHSLVREGEEVGRPARAVAHDHRHRRVVGDVLEHRSDGVGAALDDQADDGNAAVGAFFRGRRRSC
jgi:hypothetical protein